MSHVDCTFHLNDFQLDSPWGEEEVYFLLLWGEGMALECWNLGPDALEYLIEEIESGMQLSEDERKACEVDELLYQPPAPAPNRIRIVFDNMGSLQALYQPPDRLWQMVFEDTEDGAQAHIMMSTTQVVRLLESMKEKVCDATDEEEGPLSGM